MTENEHARSELSFRRRNGDSGPGDGPGGDGGGSGGGDWPGVTFPDIVIEWPALTDTQRAGIKASVEAGLKGVEAQVNQITDVDRPASLFPGPKL